MIGTLTNLSNRCLHITKTNCEYSGRKMILGYMFMRKFMNRLVRGELIQVSDPKRGEEVL